MKTTKPNRQPNPENPQIPTTLILTTPTKNQIRRQIDAAGLGGYRWQQSELRTVD